MKNKIPGILIIGVLKPKQSTETPLCLVNDFPYSFLFSFNNLIIKQNQEYSAIIIKSSASVILGSIFASTGPNVGFLINLYTLVKKD
jgi:hypothetical protein